MGGGDSSRVHSRKRHHQSSLRAQRALGLDGRYRPCKLLVPGVGHQAALALAAFISRQSPWSPISHCPLPEPGVTSGAHWSGIRADWLIGLRRRQVPSPDRRPVCQTPSFAWSTTVQATTTRSPSTVTCWSCRSFGVGTEAQKTGGPTSGRRQVPSRL